MAADHQLFPLPSFYVQSAYKENERKKWATEPLPVGSS